MNEKIREDADDLVLNWITTYTQIPVDSQAYRILVDKCVYLVLVHTGWKNLETEKPHDEELCVVYMEEYNFGWQLATYHEGSDRFYGQFHGFEPRWWMRLTKPRR